jgi:hypothetical protein
VKNKSEEDARRLEDLPCSWNSRTNIVKMDIYQSQYTFNAILIITLMTFFTEIKTNIKIHVEKQ